MTVVYETVEQAQQYVCDVCLSVCFFVSSLFLFFVVDLYMCLFGQYFLLTASCE